MRICCLRVLRHLLVWFWRYSAIAPATKGAAWEVPDLYSVALSLLALADWTFVPGAQTFTQEPKLEAVPGEIHSR